MKNDVLQKGNVQSQTKKGAMDRVAFESKGNTKYVVKESSDEYQL